MQKMETALVELRGAKEGLEAQLGEAQTAHQTSVEAHRQSTADIAAARELESQVRQESEDLTSQFDALTAKLTLLDISHTTLIEAEASARIALSSLAEDKELALQQLSTSHAAELATLSEQIATLTTSLANAESSSGSLQTLVGNLRAELEAVKTTSSDAEPIRLELQSALSTITSLEDDKTSLAVQLADAQALHQALSTSSQEALDSVSSSRESELALRSSHTTEIATLSDQIANLTSSLADADSASDALRAVIGSLRTELDAARTSSSDTEPIRLELGNALSTISSLESEKTSLTSQLADVQALHQTLSTSHQEAVDSLSSAREAELVLHASYTTEISTLSTQIATLTSSLAEADTASSALQKLVESLQVELESSKANDAEPMRLELESAQSTISALEERQSSLTNQLADAQSLHQTLSLSHREALDSLATSREAELSLQSESTSHRTRLGELVAQIGALEVTHQTLKDAEAAARSSLLIASTASAEELARLSSQHSSEIVSLRDQIDSLSSQLSSTTESSSSLQGSVSTLQEELRAVKLALEDKTAAIESQGSQLEARETVLNGLKSELKIALEKAQSQEVKLDELETDVRRLELEKDEVVRELEGVSKALEANEATLAEQYVPLISFALDPKRERLTLVDPRPRYLFQDSCSTHLDEEDGAAPPAAHDARGEGRHRRGSPRSTEGPTRRRDRRVGEEARGSGCRESRSWRGRCREDSRSGGARPA
jgi:chromosome segregation ATPase